MIKKFTIIVNIFVLLIIWGLSLCYDISSNLNTTKDNKIVSDVEEKTILNSIEKDKQTPYVINSVHITKKKEFEGTFEKNTYKDHLLGLTNIIGKINYFSVTGYVLSDYKDSEIKNTNDYLYLDARAIRTDINELQTYEYYISNNRNVKVSIVYGYGKVYNALIVIKSPDQHIWLDPIFLSNDLSNYLEYNNWEKRKGFIFYDDKVYEFNNLVIDFSQGITVIKNTYSINLYKMDDINEFKEKQKAQIKIDEKKDEEIQKKIIRN